MAKSKRVTGNTKLSKKIINKIMSERMTTTEISLLLHIALKQDVYGNVDGLYYKDVCLELGVVTQSFLNALTGLQEKGFIYIKSSKSDAWDVRILNNQFKDNSDYAKGYLNINHKVLFTWDFKRLKANEKKLCLKILSIYDPSKRIMPSAKTIADWLGIKSQSMAIIYSYCYNIRNFFPNTRVMGKKGPLVKFDMSIAKYPVEFRHTANNHYLLHKIKHICRQKHVNYTTADLNDLVILINQYYKKGLKKVFSIIGGVMATTKSIIPRLINHLINMSEEDKSDTIFNLELSETLPGVVVEYDSLDLPIVIPDS
ncbi:MAG: hypothetical protein N4A40_12635 [Tissierellales bacterium]|jgi:hypothetical protein|nr:hypothetical protein [Tissierellales bacterium]